MRGAAAPQAQEGRRNQGQGIAGAGRQPRGGGRSLIPPGIARMMKEKRSAKSVSLNFGSFSELPEPVAFHNWLKNLGVLGQELQEKQVEWVDRNVFTKTFYVYMKDVQGAEWLAQEFGDGRDWRDPDSNTVTRIKATWEGQSWKQLVIRGIDPRTANTTVHQVFDQYGEVKQLQFLELEGVKYNQATLLVKVRDGAELPVIVYSQRSTGPAEAMERWEVDYRGRPRTVCYGCFQAGHIRRDCAGAPVTVAQLSRPGRMPGTYAQVARRQEDLENERLLVEIERQAEQDNVDEQEPDVAQERLEREEMLISKNRREQEELRARAQQEAEDTEGQNAEATERKKTKDVERKEAEAAKQ